MGRKESHGYGCDGFFRGAACVRGYVGSRRGWHVLGAFYVIGMEGFVCKTTSRVMRRDYMFGYAVFCLIPLVNSVDSSR